VAGNGPIGEIRCSITDGKKFNPAEELTGRRASDGVWKPLTRDAFGLPSSDDLL